MGCQEGRNHLRGQGACSTDRVPARLDHSARVGIYIGGLGVRAEVSGVGNRV